MFDCHCAVILILHYGNKLHKYNERLISKRQSAPGSGQWLSDYDLSRCTLDPPFYFGNESPFVQAAIDCQETLGLEAILRGF